MRAPQLLAALAALLLAGCATPAAPAPPGGPGTPLAAGWTLDCALGSFEAGPWQQPCLARASHTEGSKSEIWLAVNPTDPANVVLGAKDNDPANSPECVWNGVFVTHDAGRTWRDVVIGGPYAQRQPTDPYFGYACNTDPMIAFSADGAVHYVVEMYNLGGQDSHGPLGPDPTAGRALLLPGWKLVLATSTDGGDTWPQAVLLDQADGISAINDYSRMTVAPSGTILVAINSFSGGPFIFAGQADTFCHVIASRDGGQSAELPVVVTATAQPTGVGCQVVSAAPDGTIVLASGGPQTWWSWSGDGGRTFSDPVRGFTYQPIQGTFNESQYRTGTNFEAAFDATQGPNAGALYIIYADGGAGDADVFVRRSDDNGHTFRDPVRVNDDNGTNNQFMSNIVVADDGSVHAFFMDKRYDPANKLIGITHAVSVDGGARWANERVTNVSWDGDLGVHQERFPFIGDYIGIGTSQGVVWGGFPDTSLGDVPVVAAARVARAG
jgi:hypothetical protein